MHQVSKARLVFQGCQERMDSPEFLESLPSLASQDLKVMLDQKESLDLME